MLILPLLFFVLNYSNAFLQSKQTCKILALEGGGDKGAYQAGALKGLMNSLSPEEVDYDFISGVSLGAVNAAIFATYDKGQEKEAAQEIVELWHSVKGEGDIYKNWFPLGIIQGLTKESLYNTKIYQENLEKLFKGRTLKKQLIIGATNANNGQYRYFDEESFAKQKFTDAILASSAFPVVFQPRDYLGSTYYDGLLKRSVDFITAINKCKDLGFEEQDIVLDIILCNSSKLERYEKEKYRPLNALERLVEILAYQVASWDIENLTRYFKDVKVRYLIKPTQSLPNAFYLYEFDDKQIHEMLDLGEQDAHDAVKSMKNN